MGADQEKAQQTPSGKMGAEEPSSHAPEPGAPANTDTVPAKYSQKNAAGDQLITTAYTFKLLSDDERCAIYEALKRQAAGSAFSADIGTELPPGIELRPVPDDLAALRGDARSRAARGDELGRGGSLCGALSKLRFPREIQARLRCRRLRCVTWRLTAPTP